MFRIARTVGTVSALTTPLFILVIILSNQKNRRTTVVELFRRISRKCSKLRSRKKKEDSRQSSRASFLEGLDSYRNSIGIEMVEQPLQDSYLGDLKNKNRASLLSTLLACISIHHKQLKNYIDLGVQMRTSAVQQDSDGLFLWNYSEKSHFSLSDSLRKHYQHILVDRIVAVRMRFTAYAPTVLNQFVHMDRVKGIGESLTPRANFKEILKDCQNNEGSGGRSGQFFFFNSNGTLILKTVSSDEKHVFIDRIQQFHDHFRTHPHSLIVKLYSVFTVEARDLEERIDFTLMGNILGKVDRKYVLRTYDLKGSTHSRDVMKGQNVSEQMGKTMKDVDFERVERRLWLNKDDRRHILEVIRSDSRFFMESGLIDYSLIVIKVDHSRLVRQNPQHSFLDDLLFFRNVREEGQVYFLGIIDYLQTWNIRKRGEKWYKSILNKAEGISSQDPSYYSQRFIAFCERICQDL